MTSPVADRPGGRWRSWPRVGDQRLGGLRRQLVVLSTVMSAVAALVLVVVLHLLLDTIASRAVGTVLSDRLDALIGAVQESSSGQQVEVPQTRLEAGDLVYDASGELVAGQAPPVLADELASVTEAAIGADQQPVERTVDDRYRIRARTFDTPVGAPATAVVVEPLQRYERDEGAVLAVSVMVGLAVVVVAGILTDWATRRALAPVGAMARTAQEWSEQDLQRRFDLGPPDNEIRALGETLDTLLERVAQAIRAEQRLSAELAHEMRTPLTSLLATAELVAQRDDLDPQVREDMDDILRAGHTLAETITVLMDMARGDIAQLGTTDTVPLAGVVDTTVRRHVRHAEVTVDVGDDLVLAVPGEIAVRALAPVLANADHHGGHVWIGARCEGGLLHVEVTDDGPGVEDALRERLFLPGVSGGTGSGLGLALARRVAREAGGDVNLIERPDGQGAVFVVSVPGHKKSAEHTAP